MVFLDTATKAGGRVAGFLYLSRSSKACPPAEVSIGNIMIHNDVYSCLCQ